MAPCRVLLSSAEFCFLASLFGNDQGYININQFGEKQQVVLPVFGKGPLSVIYLGEGGTLVRRLTGSYATDT